MRDSKVYPFTIPANGSITLLVSGDYFKIKSATGLLNVTGDRFGTLAGMLPGQGLRDTNFERLTLKDETGAINNGAILISDGTFVDDRITGEVNVIDGGKLRTYSGGAYLASQNLNATATFFAIAQIFNPATSKKNTILEKLIISSSTGGKILIGRYNSALASGGAAASPESNKIHNGVESTSQIRYGISGTALALNTMLLPYIAANQSLTYDLKEPIILGPGYGINVNHTVLNADLTVGFEFYEELIP